MIPIMLPGHARKLREEIDDEKSMRLANVLYLKGIISKRELDYINNPKILFGFESNYWGDPIRRKERAK